MPLLYYWRPDNYRRDLDYGAGYHLNQSNSLLHSIDLGDSLWAFTRNRQGRYVLAVELIIRAKTTNPPQFRYGRYRIWGDLAQSRYFRVDGAPGAENVLRFLSPRMRATYLGQSFQGHAAVRLLTLEDHHILRTFASDLPLEPRARLLPEERLEAAILLGDNEIVYKLLEEEKPGVAESRQKYLYTEAPTRNRELADELQYLYDGQCQITGWKPRDYYGHNLCHAHHIHWLSRGGSDTLDNLVLVSPNVHAAIHRCDAPFDFSSGTFLYPNHREGLLVNRHLAAGTAPK